MTSVMLFICVCVCVCVCVGTCSKAVCGCVPHAQHMPCMQYGDTALTVAANGGHCDIVDLLLKCGINKEHANQVRHGDECAIVCAYYVQCNVASVYSTNARWSRATSAMLCLCKDQSDALHVHPPCAPRTFGVYLDR